MYNHVMFQNATCRASSDFDGDYLRFCRTNDSPADNCQRFATWNPIVLEIRLKVAVKYYRLIYFNLDTILKSSKRNSYLPLVIKSTTFSCLP